MSNWDVGHFTAALVERAQTAGDLHDLRQCILKDLQSLFGCETAYWGDLPASIGDEHHASRSPDRATRAAMARLAGARDRYDVPKAMRAVHADGGVAIDDEIFNSTDRDRLPLYTEVVRPAGIRTYLAGLPRFRGQPVSMISFGRHARGARFAARDKEQLRSILASLGLVDAAFRAGAVAAVFDLGGPSAAPAQQRLSPREAQVAALITRGLQNKEIADLLGTSLDTVRKQSIRVYEKLRVKGRMQLLVRALAAPGDRSFAAGAAAPFRDV